jgi:hypothetical protein
LNDSELNDYSSLSKSESDSISDNVGSNIWHHELINKNDYELDEKENKFNPKKRINSSNGNPYFNNKLSKFSKNEIFNNNNNNNKINSKSDKENENYNVYNILNNL